MRVIRVCLNIGFCCLMLAFAGCSSLARKGAERSALEASRNIQWPAGKRAAISLTFDDARPSQLDRGLPILDQCGVKATFYVSLGSMEKRLDDWKKAAANGHEIGNHSLRHPCSGNFPFSRDRALEDYTLAQMQAELRQANRDIERLVGVRPVSFAYPCGQKFVGRGVNLKSYVPLVAEEFMTGRGWMDEWANDPAFCDMAQLMAMELDGKDFEQIKQIIDRTLTNGGWLVFCGHDVGDSGRQVTLAATLRSLCEYAKDPANGIWLADVGTISHYVLSQRTGQGG